jgi:hypothetical protein
MNIKMHIFSSHSLCVIDGLKILIIGGIKLSTCQILTSKLRDRMIVRRGGIPHVARFIQQRIEHQRDRQKNMTQPWNGKEISLRPSSTSDPGKIKETQQIEWI